MMDNKKFGRKIVKKIKQTPKRQRKKFSLQTFFVVGGNQPREDSKKKKRTQQKEINKRGKRKKIEKNSDRVVKQQGQKEENRLQAIFQRNFHWTATILGARESLVQMIGCCHGPAYSQATSNKTRAARIINSRRGWYEWCFARSYGSSSIPSLSLGLITKSQ